MAHPERRVRPGSDEYFFLTLARLVSGKTYPSNYGGIRRATKDMRVQHERVRLQIPRLDVRGMVQRREPVIREPSEQVTRAIQDENYPDMMRGLNDLFGYADIDYHESLGGEALALSLNAHLASYKKLDERFRTTDRFLIMAGDRIPSQIQQDEASGNVWREHYLLR